MSAQREEEMKYTNRSADKNVKNVGKTKTENVQICHNIQSYTDACSFFFFFQCISSDLNANLLNKNNNFWNRSKLFCLPHQVCSSLVIVWCLFPRANQSPCFGDQMNDTSKGNENVLSEKLKIWGSNRKDCWSWSHNVMHGEYEHWTLNRLNNF